MILGKEANSLQAEVVLLWTENKINSIQQVFIGCQMWVTEIGKTPAPSVASVWANGSGCHKSTLAVLCDKQFNY